MRKSFELETLRIRMSDAKFALLDLHQRVQRAMRELILEGALSPGLKLPATRSLAESLGIARDTVENAYMQLHRDGYIIRQQGSGSYVSEAIGMELRGRSLRRVKSQEHERRVQAPGMSLSRRGNLIFESGGVADQQTVKAFTTGLPETRTFPVDVWERLQRRAFRDHRTSVLLHGDPQGAKPLREAIATYLNLERGAKVSADQILVLSSTRQALFLCAQLLVDAGKPILLENPGYVGAKKAFESAEAQIVPIDVDEQGIRTDLLRADRSGATCVYVTPSHQFPTGVTMSLERRLDLIHWAAESSRWIIEDDYDSEFHYDGMPTACVQGLDKYARTIYIGTFNKTLYPGLRMGYIALPHGLVKAFTDARSIMDGHTPQVLQLTLARFMEDGYYNSHVRTMRKLYASRREVILESLGKHLTGIVTAPRPKGGLQVPCMLEPGWSEQDTIRRAAAAGVVLPGLSRLYAGEHKQAGWLLGYSSLTAYEIESAILCLANALRSRPASATEVQ